jgi:hypothetical protein
MQKKKFEKSKNPISTSKIKLIFGTLLCNLWAMLAIWPHLGAPQKMQKNLNFQPILNIELFLTHTKSELGVLGIAKKLVKNVVHLWRQNFEKIIFFIFLQVVQTTNNHFWVSRNFRS